MYKDTPIAHIVYMNSLRARERGRSQFVIGLILMSFYYNVCLKAILVNVSQESWRAPLASR